MIASRAIRVHLPIIVWRELKPTKNVWSNTWKKASASLQRSIRSPVLSFHTDSKWYPILLLSAHHFEGKDLLQIAPFITAVNPHLGYEAAARIAREAIMTGQSVRDLCLQNDVVGFNSRQTMIGKWTEPVIHDADGLKQVKYEYRLQASASLQRSIRTSGMKRLRELPVKQSWRGNL
jgi:hypothetical protein